MDKPRISFAVGGCGRFCLKGNSLQSVLCCGLLLQLSGFSILHILSVGLKSVVSLFIAFSATTSSNQQRSKVNSTSKESCAMVGGIPRHQAVGTQLEFEDVLIDNELSHLPEPLFTGRSDHTALVVPHLALGAGMTWSWFHGFKAA